MRAIPVAIITTGVTFDKKCPLWVMSKALRRANPLYMTFRILGHWLWRNLLLHRFSCPPGWCLARCWHSPPVAVVAPAAVPTVVRIQTRWWWIFLWPISSAPYRWMKTASRSTPMCLCPTVLTLAASSTWKRAPRRKQKWWISPAPSLRSMSFLMRKTPTTT